MSKSIKQATQITSESWGDGVTGCLVCNRAPQVLRETNGSMGLLAISCSQCLSCTPMVTQPNDAVLLWNAMQDGYVNTLLPHDFLVWLSDGVSNDAGALGGAMRRLADNRSYMIRLYRAFKPEIDQWHNEWQSQPKVQE